MTGAGGRAALGLGASASTLTALGLALSLRDPLVHPASAHHAIWLVVAAAVAAFLAFDQAREGFGRVGRVAVLVLGSPPFLLMLAVCGHVAYNVVSILLLGHCLCG